MPAWGGLSPGIDEFLKSCWTYVDRRLPVVAADGTNTVAQLTSYVNPTFTSSRVLAFGPGIPSTQTITVAGDPAPLVCITSSTLPGNFTLTGSPFLGTNNCTHFEGIQGFGTARINVAFDGLLNAAIGTYSLTLTGVTFLPAKTEVSQTFTITVSPLLSIISPDTMNVTSGVPANFTVVATGTPTPTLSVDGVDLGGMTFTDNRNGTATISGIDSNAINSSRASSAAARAPAAFPAALSRRTLRARIGNRSGST